MGLCLVLNELAHAKYIELCGQGHEIKNIIAMP